MGTRTMQTPDDKPARFKTWASSKGPRLNKLFEAFSTQAMAESAAFTRLQIYASNQAQGMSGLDKLGEHLSK